MFLIGAGMIFLCNPNIGIIDVLPDFIGLLLIAKGLTKISYLVDKLAEAQSDFLRVSIVSGVKTAALLFLPYTDSTFSLVLTFCFSISELLIMIPAFRLLFEGFEYAGMRYGSTAVLQSDKKEHSLPSKLGSVSAAFIIARVAGAVIPELTALRLYNLGSVHELATDKIDNIKLVLQVSLSALVLVFGVIWAILLIRYFRRISRDTVFVGELSDKYNTVLSVRKFFFISRSMSKVLILLIVAVFFCFNFYIDGLNILPTVFAAVLMFFAFLLMFQYNRRSIIGAAVSLIWGFASNFMWVLQVKYAVSYTPSSSLSVSKAGEMYRQIEIMSIVSAVCEFICYAVFFAVIVSIMGQHLMMIEGCDDKSSRSSELLKKVLGKSGILVVIIATISIGLNGAYTFVVVNNPSAWIINFGANTFLLVCIMHTASSIKAKIYDRLAELDK